MYYFYMGSVLLPIPPEKLTLKIKNANKTMTLINEGEVNFLKSAGLTDVEFDVLIPSVKYSFANYDEGFKSPAFFINHFRTLKTDKKPFQFIVTREMPDGKLMFDTNMTVSMESYTVKEQSTDGFDLTVSIKLKQYRNFSTKIVKVINDNASIEKTRETSNSPAPKQETTYTVKKGDCLWNIAKKFYGNGSKYVNIYNANKDKIKNPNLIYVGQVLIIPDVNSVQTTSASTTTTTTSSNKSSTTTKEKMTLSVKFTGVNSYYGKVIATYYQDGKYRRITYSEPFSVQVDKGSEVTLQCKGANGHSFNFIGGSVWTGTTSKTATINTNQSVTIRWVR